MLLFWLLKTVKKRTLRPVLAAFATSQFELFPSGLSVGKSS